MVSLFSSQSSVIELLLEGSDEPLQVTPGHMIFSLDRETWIPAGKLRRGEKLATLDGQVRLLEIRGGGELIVVRNLEVDVGAILAAVESIPQLQFAQWRSGTNGNWPRPCEDCQGGSTMIPRDEMAVVVQVTDPWDWQDAAGDTMLSGQIVGWEFDASNGRAKFMLRLDQTVSYRGSDCRYFVGSARHEEVDANQLADGDEVLCSLVRLPEERAAGDAPFDLSWWRGGIGLVASVRRKARKEHSAE